MTVPHWDTGPDVWDSITLGAVTLPGVSSITISRELKIDEKDAKGKNAATMTVQGVKNASGTIKNVVSTSEELALLMTALVALEPKAGKGAPVPFDVVHPVATMRGLTSVLVTKVSGPELSAGLMTTTLDWKQFDVPAKPPLATGGGKGNSAYNAIPTAAVTGAFSRGTINGPSSDVFHTTAKPDPKNASPYTGTWTQKNGSVFTGVFVMEDPVAKKAEDEAAKKASGGKDATTTPGKSKSVDLTDLDKPAGNGANTATQAPPSTTAADP